MLQLGELADFRRQFGQLVVTEVDRVEARQAFSAVVITCQLLNEDLLILTKVTDDFKIITSEYAIEAFKTGVDKGITLPTTQ